MQFSDGGRERPDRRIPGRGRTFVMEDGEPTLVIGRVFGASGIEMYHTQRDASGHYRDAILGVLDEMRQQWATNQSL